jgi:hypothetical protein
MKWLRRNKSGEVGGKVTERTIAGTTMMVEREKETRLCDLRYCVFSTDNMIR